MKMALLDFLCFLSLAIVLTIAEVSTLHFWSIMGLVLCHGCLSYWNGLSTGTEMADKFIRGILEIY